jgi:type VI secretion system protein ImpG
MSSQATDEVYKAFLEEMQALENLRVTYTSVHASASIEREDPEVRRLIESVALLAARSRMASQRSLLATQRRLFQQYFSFLLAPCPAAGLLQLEATGQLADEVVLPRGTEVAVTVEGQRALFLTQREVRLLPMTLDSCETLLRAKGLRIVLNFRASFPRNDEIGNLPLHVNHLDDFAASLTVQSRLKQHLDRAFVVFDQKVDEDSDGASCEVSFGDQPDDPTAKEALEHPLQQVRSFFHFPRRDLFMNVRVPSTPRGWKRFSIVLDLDSTWPRGLRLNREMFQPFTVPISNLRPGPAEPVLCEGTEGRQRIRHPNPSERWALHSVQGVYSIEKKGLMPVRPGIITAGTGSYELERSVDEDGEAHWVRLRFPEAFPKGRKIAIEALWMQPWISDLVGGRINTQLHARAIPGVKVELRGAITPHAVNPLQDSFEAMLQLLALRSKAVGLTLEELNALLEAFGVLKQGSFAALPSYLGELTTETLPEPRELGGGRRHAYGFKLREFDATLVPLVDTGLRQIAAALRAWTPDARVTMRAKLTGDGAKTLTYE